MATRGSTRATSDRERSRRKQDRWHALPAAQEQVLCPVNQAAALFQRGLARQRKGDLRGAVADFDAALEWSPQNADLFVQRALARLGYGDLFEALADAERSLRIDHRDVWAYYHHRAGRPESQVLQEAIADFDAALRTDPGHMAALLGRSLAHGWLDRHWATVGRDAVLQAECRDAQGYGVRGLARFWVGDLDGALTDLDEAINRGNRSAPVHGCRAQVRQLRGDATGALADLDDGIYLDPEHAGNYHQRGLVRQVQGDLEGARADYDAALRLDPRKACAYNSRAGIRLLQGDIEGARTDCTEAIRLDPENPLAHANQARLRWTCPREALADCAEALRLDPHCAWAYCIRGSLRAHAQQPFEAQAAATDYQKALQLDPRLGALLQAGDAGNEQEVALPFLTLGFATAWKPAALQPPSGRRLFQRAAAFLQNALWILAGVLVGMGAGALYPSLSIGAGELSGGANWLLAWALLGGLGAAFASAAGMHSLVRCFGGYGNKNDPGSPALNVEPAARAILSVPFAAVSRLLAPFLKYWLRPLFFQRAGRWSSWESPAAPAGTRMRRSLAAVSLLALLHAGARGVVGGCFGITCGFLASWAWVSIVRGVLLGSLLGLWIGVLLARPGERSRKKRLALALAGGMGCGILLGLLSAVLPELVAGALTACLLVGLLSKNADSSTRTAILGALISGVLGVSDGAVVYRIAGGMAGCTLWWALAGALSGAFLGFLVGGTHPSAIMEGPLYQRLFGGLADGESRKYRLQVGVFTAIAGLLAGGRGGIICGSVLAVLAAVLAGPEEEAVYLVLGGALCGGVLGYLHAWRIVGCRVLLKNEERLELTMPMPCVLRVMIILATAALGGAAGWLLWQQGQAIGGPLYSVLAGVGLGVIVITRLRAMVIPQC